MADIVPYSPHNNTSFDVGTARVIHWVDFGREKQQLSGCNKVTFSHQMSDNFPRYAKCFPTTTVSLVHHSCRIHAHGTPRFCKRITKWAVMMVLQMAKRISRTVLRVSYKKRKTHTDKKRNSSNGIPGARDPEKTQKKTNKQITF